jgi:hypothetical protein
MERRRIEAEIFEPTSWDNLETFKNVTFQKVEYREF